LGAHSGEEQMPKLYIHGVIMTLKIEKAFLKKVYRQTIAKISKVCTEKYYEATFQERVVSDET
jgi:hypothetical protein